MDAVRWYGTPLRVAAVLPDVLGDNGTHGTARRLRRDTPREKAWWDSGRRAFDFAVAVRRPAVLNGTSAALGDLPFLRGRGGAGRADGPADQAEGCRPQGEPPHSDAQRCGSGGTCGACCLQVDCAVGDWSGWSQCAAATGRQDRTRPIVTRPSSNGRTCPALDDATDCAVACVLGAWTPWGGCSASCGGGTRTRRRAVEVSAKNGGMKCGSVEEADACNTGDCEKKARQRHVQARPRPS